MQLHDSNHSFYRVNIGKTECLFFYDGTMSPVAMLMLPPHWRTAAFNSSFDGTVQFYDGTKKYSTESKTNTFTYTIGLHVFYQWIESHRLAKLPRTKRLSTCEG